MGAKRSETALTDSTTPNAWWAVTLAPTFGSSTKTTSPSCSCANSVMPTRTRSPSRLAHSCSRVYLRSAGTFAIGRSPLLSAVGVPAQGSGARRSGDHCARSFLHPRRVKRGLHDAGRLDLAADLDTDVGADGGMRARHVRHRDRALHRGAVGARGDDARRTTVLHHGVTVTRHGAIGHLETDELA